MHKTHFNPQALVIIASTLCLSTMAQAATPVFINEIHYDDNGTTDSGEAIEIAGPAGTDLSGWSIVLYNGNGGAVYNTKNLSGTITDQTGNGFGTLSFSYPSNGIQNGSPDGIALVNGSTVVQFLSYEPSPFAAVGGPANGMTSTDIGVTETNSTPVGYSLQLKGSGSSYEDFTWNTASANTFGTINSGQSFGGITPPPPPPVSQCGQAATLISAIQGSSGFSPLSGSVQHVEAVVSADFQGSSNLNGFFVQQSGDSDGNPATSEGLFVVSNIPVNAGDKVHVVGAVGEPFGMTRLESVSSVDVCSTGNALPAAVEINLPFDTAGNDPERWEGMLVHLPQTLTVTENFNLARFGEFLLSANGRLMTPTQIALPGQAAIDVAAANALNQLLVDDAASGQNLDPVIYPQPSGLSAANSLRNGDSVTGATGVLAYDFGSYRLQPTQPLSFAADNARPAAPQSKNLASLKIASFNVLNYFNGNGVGGGFPTARGANTLLEFNRQRDKIIRAIHALNADVVGLMEIENDGYTANHLKSKGSACDDVNDPDTGDGQGNCNLTRTAAAEALTSWLASDPTRQGANNTLIMGDLNSYAMEDPITAIKTAGYINLLETQNGNQTAYSYVFDGAAGYLDHALANAGLSQQVKSITEWHINADEPRALDYNTEFKTPSQIVSFYAADAYRSSDHDPLLIQAFVPGDLDNDGDVDANDASQMRLQVGKCRGKSGFNREADYDQSGCVSMADYRVWYGYFTRYAASSQ
jgi:predicted extracellular nuclease